MQSYLRRLGYRALRPVMARLQELEQTFDAGTRVIDRKIQDSWHDQNVRTDHLKILLTVDHETARETADLMAAGIHALRADLDALVEWGSPPGLARLRQGTLREVDAAVATALNRAADRDGFAAQAGVYFEPPAQVTWGPGRAWIAEVTAGSVVNPFLAVQIGRLERPAEVLDLANGDLALDLAVVGLGHRLAIAGRDGFPIDHPRVQTIELTPGDGTVAPFDAVLLVTTAPGDTGPRLERWGSSLPGLVKPGGLLAAALAVGAPGPDGAESLPAEAMTGSEVLKALDGWDVTDRALAVQRNAFTWDVVADDNPGEAGILLVSARRSR